MKTDHYNSSFHQRGLKLVEQSLDYNYILLKWRILGFKILSFEDQLVSGGFPDDEDQSLMQEFQSTNDCKLKNQIDTNDKNAYEY